MQQDKNDIENKLRQLEKQQLPDLSHMDEHWVDLKEVLQPAPEKGSRSNKWLWAISLLLLVGAVILFINYNDAINRDEPLVSKIIPAKEIQPDLQIPDSAATYIIPVTKMPLSKILAASVSVKVVKNKKSKNEADKLVLNLPVKLNLQDSTLKAVNPDAQKILNDLLASLAKNAEEFIINNTKDTILLAAEGSSLYIPAKSLGGSNKVKISLREFYKTSDIVLNELSTTSNEEQLITGGMVHISASVNDKTVNVFPGKAIKLYMPDTSKLMLQMELFKGEEKKAGHINWIKTGQSFGRLSYITEVRVLDLRNEPFRTIETERGTIGYFAVSQNSKLSRAQLRSVLKEKYGYYKVRIRRTWRGSLFQRWGTGTSARFDGVGDSAWINTELASTYKLPSTQARINQGSSDLFGNVKMSVLNIGSRSAKVTRSIGVDTLSYNFVSDFKDVTGEFEKKYSVDINSLGWINCDRFYNDHRQKVDYYVNLQDSAINFYTMIVFSKIRSMMTGYMSGNNVQFTNVPLGEPVKIISIGVDRKGEVIMAMKETKISKETFTGLQFESTSASTIKSVLRKEDN